MSNHGHEPVGSTANGAPIMQPDRRHDRAPSHWCPAVGSTVYAPRVECPACSDEGEDA